MVTRRKFLGMLAVLPAVTALAGAGIRLPRKDEIEVDASPYLTSKDAWFVHHEHEAGLKHFSRFSNRIEPSADLDARMLEDILKQIHADVHVASVRPTKIIVSPQLRNRAVRILERAGLNWFDRLLYDLAHL